MYMLRMVRPVGRGPAMSRGTQGVGSVMAQAPAQPRLVMHKSLVERAVMVAELVVDLHWPEIGGMPWPGRNPTGARVAGQE